MYVICEPSLPVALAKVCFGYRKIPLSRWGHVIGWHPVRPGHAQVPFESRLERDAISWCADLPGFERIEAQPFTVWASDEAGSLRYTPDFRVWLDSEAELSSHAGVLPATTFLVEVKYEADWEAQGASLRSLLSAASQVTHEPLVVLTERDVRLVPEVRHG